MTDLANCPISPQGPFFVTEDRQEALSRLLFAVEHRRPLAIVTGPCGVGKSRLIRELLRQLRPSQRWVVEVDAAGLERTEFAGRLLAACGREAGGSSPWTMLDDLIFGQGLTGDAGVWLIDHVDEAVDDLAPLVDRLAQMLLRRQCGGTLIVATSDVGRLGTLRHRADWPVTLSPWTVEDFATIVQTHQDRLPRFATNALHVLTQAAGGSPAVMLHFSELVLLAAELHGLSVIDDTLVREAMRSTSGVPFADCLWTGPEPTLRAAG